MMEAKRRGLGRGLEALIPLPSDGRESGVPQLIAVDQIRPSSQQLRRSFEAEPLRELADSIRRHGVLQPVIVRALPDGYELLAGERRWRAARLAGQTRIPALVRNEPDDLDRLVIGLIENLQRADLNPLEEAHGVRALIDQYGLTQEEVALRLGKNRVSVAQALRLLQTCPAVQSALATGALNAGHARALAGLPDAAAQERGLKVVLGRRLSVRQAEAWVKTYQPALPRRRPSDAQGALEQLTVEVQDALGVPVAITGSLRRGRVCLSYSSRDELQRLYEKLTH